MIPTLPVSFSVSYDAPASTRGTLLPNSALKAVLLFRTSLYNSSLPWFDTLREILSDFLVLVSPLLI